MLPGETGKGLGEAGLQEKGTTPGAGAGAGRAHVSSFHLNPRQGLGQTQALIPIPYLSGIGKKCAICFRSAGGRVYVTKYLEA